MNSEFDLRSAVKTFIIDSVCANMYAFPHYLVVEGKTDAEFYFRVLNSSILENDVSKYKLNIKEKNFLANFSNNVLNDKVNKSNPYLTITKNKEYKAFNFVIECIDLYLEKPNLFRNSKLFGIIDKDFGHDRINKLSSNLSLYPYHDRESCLIYKYLPIYLKNNHFADINLIKQIKDIILVCFEQGILEKCSIEFGSEYSYLEGYTKSFSKDYFHNNNKFKLFKIDNFEQYVKKSSSQCLDFWRFYKENRLKIFNLNFQNEFENIIAKWIMQDESDEIANTRLKRIFNFCNGHYLILQFLAFFDEIFNGFTEKRFVSEIISKTILKDSNYNYLFNISPLMNYKKFRLNNNLYLKI